jgi:hypothetical protein
VGTTDRFGVAAVLLAGAAVAGASWVVLVVRPKARRDRPLPDSRGR